MIQYRFIRANGSEVEVEIDNEEVIFEQGDIAERHEYSASYFMDGYVGQEKRYEAIADFMYGSDDFVDLTEVELIK